MITDSYNASCYIESNDGQYHMECEMISGDKEIYSEYDGDNFVDGLNEIMEDMTLQMLNKSESEPEPETLEDKVARLESLVEKLQNENKELNNTIDNLTYDHCKEDGKKSEKPLNNYKIDNTVKSFEKSFNKYDNKAIYDNLYKWLGDFSKTPNATILRWPF